MNGGILNPSWPIRVVYYDETLVRSWKLYPRVHYFIIDRAMGPFKQFRMSCVICLEGLVSNSFGISIRLTKAHDVYFDLLRW